MNQEPYICKTSYIKINPNVVNIVISVKKIIVKSSECVGYTFKDTDKQYAF